MKAFGGGAGNQTKCAVCDRSVYPNDPQITLDGLSYHKECAKCSDCKCQISLSNFCKFEKTLFCKTHYFKRFKEEGSYLGGEKYAQKSGGAYVTKDSSFVPKESSSNQTAAAAPTSGVDDAEIPSDNAPPAEAEVPEAEEPTNTSETVEAPPSETIETPVTENDASPSEATSTEAVSPAEATEQPAEEAPKTAEAEDVSPSASPESETTEGV